MAAKQDEILAVAETIVEREKRNNRHQKWDAKLPLASLFNNPSQEKGR